MHFRFPSFIALAILIIVTAPQIAIAGDADRAAPIERACGATVKDNLAAAQKALGAGNADRAALACLIDATAALNERLQNLDQGRSASGELRAPSIDFPPATAR